MNNQHLIRGLFVVGIALLFGIGSLNHSIGSLAHAGPGLFPLLVSGMLLAVGVTMTIRAWFSAAEPMQFSPRNILLIVSGLTGFALVSHWINMIAGIAVMVIVASRASAKPSWALSLKVTAGLIAIAFAFQHLLGMNLPLL